MDADAGLPSEISALRRMVRDFAEREIRPRVTDMEEREHVPDELVALLGEVGFFGIPFPEECGGAGLGEIGLAVALEELARAHASTGLMVAASSGLVASLVQRFGSDDQQQRYLRALVTGETIGAFCLTEPGGGSDVAALSTVAREAGDSFVLRGEKAYVTNGDRAGVFLTFVKTEPERGRDGISLFVVERGSPGLSVARLEDKMGLRASATAHMVFDEVRVPRANLVGELNGGFRIALATLNRSRIGIASMCLGVAKEAVDLSWRYAHERELFGQTIGDFQVSQHAFADMQIDVFAAESLVYRTALRLDVGEDVAADASMCKVLATESAQRVVDRALQMHGGVGYLRDSAIERLYRDIRSARIYEGANEVQRNNIYRVMRRERGA